LGTGGILPAAADDAVPLPAPKPTVTVAKRTVPRHIFRATAVMVPVIRVAYSVPIVIGIAF
jgi:hypothetical protein